MQEINSPDESEIRNSLLKDLEEIHHCVIVVNQEDPQGWGVEMHANSHEEMEKKKQSVIDRIMRDGSMCHSVEVIKHEEDHYEVILLTNGIRLAKRPDV